MESFLSIDDNPPAKHGFLVSTILYHVATFLEYYDMQSLYACMRAFEVTLSLSPSDIATLTAVESISMVAACPIWGVATDLHEPKYILSASLLISGSMSMILAFISNYPLMLALRVINGCTMGSIAPVTQRILLTTTESGKRGGRFGILHAVMCFGRLFGNVIVAHFSLKNIAGCFGWRICFFGHGIAEVIAGTVIFIFMKKLSEADVIVDREYKPLKTKMLHGIIYLFRNVGEIFYTKSSVILFFETFISDAPLVACVFLTMYLQYIGLSNFNAGVLSGMVLIGGLFGGLIGGVIVDAANKRSNSYGTIIVGILSLVIRLVFFFILFLVVLNRRMTKIEPSLVLMLLVVGATAMTATCVDRPLLAAVVMPKHHASAIAFSRGFAGIASQLIFIKLTTSLATDVFGYESTPLDVSVMPEALLLKNASAYKYSILSVASVGTALTIVTYLMLLFTYPKDSAFMRSRVRRESQLSIC